MTNTHATEKASYVAPKYIQDPLNEISNLRCKLDSKSRALIILSQDLLECKRERDEYKLMADQLRERYTGLKRRIDCISTSTPDSLNQSTFAQILCQVKHQNKALLYELEELKMKLCEAEGDVKLLRDQIHGYKSNPQITKDNVIERKNADELISSLEIYKDKVCLMEKDLTSLLDEKEELIMSRDGYKAKLERLNTQLNKAMRGNKTDLDECDQWLQMVDIDALLIENKFLRDKIAHQEEEQNLWKETLQKYRSLLKQEDKEILGNNEKRSFGRSKPKKMSNIISSKEVETFIASNNLNDMQLSEENLIRLKRLVVALFESSSDKSSALTLQKKTNKLLGRRIQQLEETLTQVHANEKIKVNINDIDSNPGITKKAINVNIITEDYEEKPEDDYLTPELRKLIKDQMKHL